MHMICIQNYEVKNVFYDFFLHYHFIGSKQLSLFLYMMILESD